MKSQDSYFKPIPLEPVVGIDCMGKRVEAVKPVKGGCLEPGES